MGLVRKYNVIAKRVIELTKKNHLTEDELVKLNAYYNILFDTYDHMTEDERKKIVYKV